MNGLELLALILYGAVTYYTLGLLSAQAEMGIRVSLRRFVTSIVLSPVFVFYEIRELTELRRKLAQQAMEDFLHCFEKNARNPKNYLVYLLFTLGASENDAQRVLDDLIDWSHDENDKFLAWLFDKALRHAVQSGYGYRHFVAYVGAAAQKPEAEVREACEQLASATLTKLSTTRRPRSELN